MDARWAKKNEEVHYGYKDHVTADTDHKFIRDWLVTSAKVHDSSPYFAHHYDANRRKTLTERTDIHPAPFTRRWPVSGDGKKNG